MIPSRDRLGQIQTYSQWLERRLGGRVRGMWIPERVWEQSLTSDVSRAGIQYTVLDDFHFRNAGLSEERLHGYYVTEDDGRTLSIFPGSERLRYLIPFRDPQETVEYLRRHRGAASAGGRGVRRRRREVWDLARHAQALLPGRLVAAFFRCVGGEP